METLFCLPNSYVEIKPTGQCKFEPTSHGNFDYFVQSSNETITEHAKEWINMLQSPNIGNSNQRVSFSDFHSSKQQQKTEISKIALLPLLEESINSPAMVRHCANVLSRITNYLNANQTTLVTADQPVYALGKQIQWRYPNEGNIFWMLGGLHIEMTFMSAIGNWLNGSGWVEVFEHGSRFTLARVESFLH